MTRLVHLLLLGPTLLLTTGCGEDAADDRRASGAGIAVEHTEGGETIPDLATAHDHAAGVAEEALPLRPIMQRLASDMAGFTYALWLEDYAAMAERAAAMAAHSTISAEENGRLQAELGPELHAAALMKRFSQPHAERASTAREQYALRGGRPGSGPHLCVG